jgi:hypothetical protein
VVMMRVNAMKAKGGAVRSEEQPGERYSDQTPLCQKP